jgi:hypothetical protein
MAAKRPTVLALPAGSAFALFLTLWRSIDAQIDPIAVATLTQYQI